MDIWHWRKMVEDGNVDLARANGSVVMMDQHLTPTARWDFEEAWPIKVSGPQLKSDSNQIGVEELVIVHRRLWRVIV
jgi:phage tail-like protein